MRSRRAYFLEYKQRQKAAHMLFRVPLPVELGGGWVFDPNHGPPELRPAAESYERVMEGSRRYAREHREEIKARQKHYSQTHRAELDARKPEKNARQKAWREANPEWHRLIATTYRMRAALRGQIGYFLPGVTGEGHANLTRGLPAPQATSGRVIKAGGADPTRPTKTRA